MLKVARDYIEQHTPAFKESGLSLHSLDGPPGSPRYAVSAEVCITSDCPFGINKQEVSPQECPILDCHYHQSVRLLLTREGEVVKKTLGETHWE